MFAKLGMMNPWKFRFCVRNESVVFMIYDSFTNHIHSWLSKGHLQLYIWIYSRTCRTFISELETSRQKVGIIWYNHSKPVTFIVGLVGEVVSMIHDKIPTNCFCPHPHAHRTNLAMCGARTRAPILASAYALAQILMFLLLFFLLLKIKKFKCYVRTCVAYPHIRGLHAPACTFLKTFSHPFAHKSTHTNSLQNVPFTNKPKKNVRVGNHTYYWCNL